MRTTDFRTALLTSLPAFPEEAPLAWASLCGAVSIIGLRWDWAAVGQAAGAILLASFVFRWIAGSVASAQWATPRNPDSPPQITVPYMRTGSPASSLLGWVARTRQAWQRHKVWPQTALLFAATGLLLALGLGTPGVWVGAAGLAASALAGVWRQKRPLAAGAWTPLALTALAWILGAVSMDAGADWRLTVSLFFGAAASGLAVLRRRDRRGQPLVWAGLTAPAILLITQRLVVPAVAVLFLAAPAYVLAPCVEESPDGYARAVRCLMWISMAVTALALGW